MMTRLGVCTALLAALVMAGFCQPVVHAGAVAYMLDGTTMNHFDPSGNTGLPGGWNNNGFVGAGDGTAFLLDGSTMYHVTQSGLTSLPGGWNNQGFVGAGDGTAYFLDGSRKQTTHLGTGRSLIRGGIDRRMRC